MNRWRCGVAMVLGLAAMPAWAAMKTQPVEWKHQGTTFSGVLVYDDGEHDQRPGLVMVPNWKGVNESAVEKAKQLAGDDYVVLVADVYGKDVRPKTDAEAGPVASKLRNDRPLLRARALEAVNVLKAQAGKVPLDASRIGAVGLFRRHHGAGTGPCRCAVGRCGQPARWVVHRCRRRPVAAIRRCWCSTAPTTGA